MPYFKWTGIDLSGKIRHGKRYAQSPEKLDALLFKKDIALLKCTPTSPIWLARISVSTHIQFFTQLATLLRAGILLPQALSILADQVSDAALQQVIHAVADDVQEGIPIQTACAKHPHAFNYLMIHTIEVGNNAGNLPAALDLLSHHLESMAAFYKRLKSAIMLPAFTLLFFCIVAVFLFVVIVPRFADLFANAQQELPPLTKLVLHISEYLRSYHALSGIAIAAGIWASIKMICASQRGRYLRDTLLIRTPYISSIIIDTSMISFLQSLAMLLKSGMQMAPALHIARNTIHNQILNNEINKLESAIQAGSSLSQAMEYHDTPLFNQDLIALIRVGEESGSMSNVLIAASDIYRTHADRSLSFLTTIIQPLLVIFLGVLIAALIFAVYLPIFNLANVV